MYKAAMEEAAEKIDLVTEKECLNVEDVMQKTDAITKKLKYKAFGKFKTMTKKVLNQRLEDRPRAAQGL